MTDDRPRPPVEATTLDALQQWVIDTLMTGDYGPTRTQVTCIGIDPGKRRLVASLNRHDPDYAAWLTDVSDRRIVVDDRPGLLRPDAS